MNPANRRPHPDTEVPERPTVESSRTGATFWQQTGDDEILILDSEGSVAHLLQGDAAVAGRALLGGGPVPHRLRHLAHDLLASGTLPAPADPSGITRRSLLGRAGQVATVVGVTSIVLPAAHAAASGATGPGAVTNLTSSDIESTSVTLTWDAFTGADDYTVEYQLTTGGSGWAPVAGPPTTADTTYDITFLASNTSYDFRVVANLTGGGVSDPSNTVTVLTAPAAPTSVTATTTSLTSVTVSWS